MSTNLKKHYRTLGFCKILEELSKKTSCEDSQKKVMQILPSNNIDVVRELLQETADAHMLIARFKGPSFYGLSNIGQYVMNARAGAMLGTAELLKIAQTVSVFNSLDKFKEQFSDMKTTLDSYFDQITPNKYLVKRIKSCILSEDEIADDASPELFSIRRKIRHNTEKIREQLNKMLRSPNIQKYLQENIVTVKSDRFVLPVKSEFRKEISGLVHESSASGSTLFIEPMSVVEANNDIRILRQNEKKEIDKILKDLSEQVSNFSGDILTSYKSCVELDIIFAKAELAYSMHACLPKINDSGKINLKKARHPLIEKNEVVPINISLGEDFDTLVITGPNTGGKTVSLKILGLFSLMAMSGFMIPAAEGSEVSVFDYVLSDIGDEQSIEQSLSTFSSHMVNIISILELADKKSLILLDELGAGTDPAEGAALATSILENLKKKGSKIAATTHYTELKSYALSSPRVQNASCEFDINTLRPTYNLLIGTPGSSNAFAIASRLGIPDAIISKANNFLSEENNKFEDVVRILEKKRISLENESKEIEKLKKQIQKEYENIIQEKTNLKAQCELELKKAKAKAEVIASRATAMADEIISEVKAMRKSGYKNDNSVSKLKSDLNKINQIIDPIEQKENLNYKLPRKLKIGDNVLIFDINKKGTIIEVNASKNEVTVQAGAIKTRVSIDNIRLLNEKVNKPVSSVSRKNLNGKMRSASRELDVRGKSAMEAILEVDAFIDSAVLANVNQLTIIHGKGTGILRTEISKHLKKHPSVKSFRLGSFGEGESGVTILELK